MSPARLSAVVVASWLVAVGAAHTTSRIRTPAAPTATSAAAVPAGAKVDVLFAFDTTGSMGGEISNLKASLSTSIIPAIRSEVPDVAFGLVEFRDFPVSPYGDASDFVARYRHRIQTVNTAAGISSIQSAVNALAAAGGGDFPEAGWEALYSIAGGPAILVSTYYSVFPADTPPTSIPAGETQGAAGGAFFRAGATPIIIAITDADWHDAPGSGGLNPYGMDLFGVPSRTTALTRLGAVEAKVVSVVSSVGFGDPVAQGKLLAVDTGATVAPADWGAAGIRPAACAVGQCCTGLNAAGEAPGAGGMCALTYRINQDGTGLGPAVVDGVRILVRSTVSMAMPPDGVTATATSPTTVTVSWNASSGAASYRVQRTSSGGSVTEAGTSSTLSFTDTAVAANAAYLYTVRAVDSGGRASDPSTADLATTVIFTDPALTPQVTPIRGSHLAELRTAVNAVRALAGQAPFDFSVALPAPGGTVSKSHVDELRSNLAEARSTLGLQTSFAETIIAGTTTVKASHVEELRNAVR